MLQTNHARRRTWQVPVPASRTVGVKAPRTVTARVATLAAGLVEFAVAVRIPVSQTLLRPAPIAVWLVTKINHVLETCRQISWQPSAAPNENVMSRKCPLAGRCCLSCPSPYAVCRFMHMLSGGYHLGGYRLVPLSLWGKQLLSSTQPAVDRVLLFGANRQQLLVAL